MCPPEVRKEPDGRGRAVSCSPRGRRARRPAVPQRYARALVASGPAIRDLLLALDVDRRDLADMEQDVFPERLPNHAMRTRFLERIRDTGRSGEPPRLFNN
jgi:hypothetical protein